MSRRASSPATPAGTLKPMVRGPVMNMLRPGERNQHIHVEQIAC